ncbi:hypothetical protein Trydic_g2822 [Trypoxylus dichotomus]
MLSSDHNTFRSKDPDLLNAMITPPDIAIPPNVSRMQTLLNEYLSSDRGKGKEPPRYTRKAVVVLNNVGLNVIGTLRSGENETIKQFSEHA